MMKSMICMIMGIDGYNNVEDEITGGEEFRELRS